MKYGSEIIEIKTSVLIVISSIHRKNKLEEEIES